MTETVNALSMITKAGVPAKMIMVGIASYGRSFKMTDSGCRTELCTFAGPESQAAPGACTGTAGYISNAEINDIIITTPYGIKTWSDEKADSDYLVYNGLSALMQCSCLFQHVRVANAKLQALSGWLTCPTRGKNPEPTFTRA
jgi:GH18 family chitinase